MAAVKVMEYIDYGVFGTCENFGDLTNNQEQLAGCADATRGLFGGGRIGTNTKVIEYITIQNENNDATDFGELTVARRGIASGVQG